MQEINAPRGILSGTGVITRADGTKVPFVLRSEGLVSMEQVEEALGKEAASKVNIVKEGEV